MNGDTFASHKSNLELGDVESGQLESLNETLGTRSMRWNWKSAMINDMSEIATRKIVTQTISWPEDFMIVIFVTTIFEDKDPRVSQRGLLAITHFEYCTTGICYLDGRRQVAQVRSS